MSENILEQLKLAQEQLKFSTEHVKYVTSLVQLSTAKIVAFGALFTLLGFLIGKAS